MTEKKTNKDNKAYRNGTEMGRHFKGDRQRWKRTLKRGEGKKEAFPHFAP